MLPTRSCSGASTSARESSSARIGDRLGGRALQAKPWRPDGHTIRPARSAATLCRSAAVDDVAVSEEKRDIQRLLDRPYKYGFKTIIESDTFPKGLNEDVVRAISAKKVKQQSLVRGRAVKGDQGVSHSSHCLAGRLSQLGCWSSA
jgi:Fe-S cluster assembly protein SufB